MNFRRFINIVVVRCSLSFWFILLFSVSLVLVIVERLCYVFVRVFFFNRIMAIIIVLSFRRIIAENIGFVVRK